MSGIRGHRSRGMWVLRGVVSGPLLLTEAEAEALHRATPEDPGEAKAVGELIGQVAVVAAMAQGLPDGPLRNAIEELARLQKVAINERARVARQEGKDT